ncbi:MAG TPA: anthranilate phosphoribosyltransferase [Candidatus Aquilonibacter sp.]|jgi:anthranilate phosphoribosyltransferase|nr:anthranilate phosphoribosyltransferase [Candidatus Aquilonibacter sp.]
MILDSISRIANYRQSLSRVESREVMAEVLAGNCTDAQISALLVALRMKGETVEEIVGFAEAIRAAATPLPISRAVGETNESSALDLSGTGRDALSDSALIDTSGTGGDAAGTFNISTATAFVTAGAGVRVAKHGNRSISSKCGSADVMEALGVNIQLSPECAAQCLCEVGICFLYAPDLHSSMKQVQKVRRELRLRTMFNLLGPLTNPAHASGQVVGVYALEMVEKLAEALCMLGLHRALVVHGLDGLDEITITGPTRVAEARDGLVRTYEIDPEEFGMRRAALEDISGGDAAENAAIIRDVLSGKKSPRRDVVLLNVAAALVAAGLIDHIKDGIPLAMQSIDSGAAAAKLDALANFTIKALSS